jgi:hypothetical protein
MRPLPTILLATALLCASAPAQTVLNDYARDPHQAIDQDYTQKIHAATTDPTFTSPLVDYLPASKTVPTPAKVLGDIAGAPNNLPYAEDVYKYFRLLAASSPRVQVFSIGKTEEGREMIAAAIADESLLKGAKENGARLAKLADPMTPRPSRSSRPRTPSTTSPAPSTPRRPARPPRSWSWRIASRWTTRLTSSTSARI